MSFAKSLATVSSMTGISRVVGFIRDVLMAIVLGAGPVADAFFVALKLPNLFRRITAEGAFMVSFVPTYTAKEEGQGRDAASKYAGDVTALMVTILLPLSILAIWAMPYIIQTIAPGFTVGEYRFDLAVQFSQTTFPYLLFISLCALLGGVLNAHSKFAPFAAAPILFNICLIVALLSGDVLETAGHALSLGILISGLIQLVFLMYFIKRYKISVQLGWPKLNEDTKRLFKLMIPGIIGAGVVQINLFIDIILASFAPTGGISAMYYADRLNQLPLGIVGIAIGTALLPMLSRAITKRDTKNVNELYSQALLFGLILSVPAAVALAIVPHSLIRGLFEYGAFTQSDTEITGNVLRAYAIGLPGYILAKVFSTYYFANQDTRTPVKFSIFTTACNIILSVILIQYMGVVGIALATSIASWMQVALYVQSLRKVDRLSLEKGFSLRCIKMLLSVIVMGGALYFFDDVLNLMPAVQTFTLTFVGLLIYAAVVFLTKTITMNDIKQIKKAKT